MGQYVKVEIAGCITAADTLLLSVLEIQAHYRVLTPNSSQPLHFMSVLTSSSSSSPVTH